MGNQNSAEPQYVDYDYDYATTTNKKKKKPSTNYKVEEKFPIQRKPSRITDQHGHAVVDDDDTFTKYIQRAKYKIKRFSTVGRGHHHHHHHEEQQHKPAAASDHVSNNVAVDNKKGNNEVDQFSNFIQNARKKLTTSVSTMGKISSFKKGNKDNKH